MNVRGVNEREDKRDFHYTLTKGYVTNRNNSLKFVGLKALFQSPLPPGILDKESINREKDSWLLVLARKE